MRLWIDIENEPQVQYMSPFKEAFEGAGAEVVVTARDEGSTIEQLRNRGIEPLVVGSAYGASKAHKATGTIRRAGRLTRALRAGGGADAMLGTSRAGAIAARRLRARSFFICDYEGVELGVFRRCGSTVIHPEAIEPSLFAQRGFSSDRLVAFDGLKEDISFSGMSLEGIAPHPFPEAAGRRLVLFRPAREDSHYFRAESHRLGMAFLKRMAEDPDSVLVLSPRQRSQIEDLERFDWRCRPIVLERSVPFVSLLKGVDAVVSGGGTMLREAACLGVPAVSTFRSGWGCVDRMLASEGRLQLAASPADLPSPAELVSRRLPPRDRDPQILERLTAAMLARSA